MGHALPTQLEEIADAIGEDAVHALVAACGGTRIYIPATLSDDHWLIETLGRAAAEKLCSYFRVYGPNRTRGHGSHAEIPAFTRSSYNKTRALIEKYDDGLTSVRLIALKVGVTERTVARHRRARRKKVQSR